MAAHIVKCLYCGKSFDTNKCEFVQIKRRYAHKSCHEAHESGVAQELNDQQQLDEYIMKLFNMSYVDARIRKQINKYIEDYQYTYSGILKALIYHFEIKKGDIDKANNGIGIVPYVYQQAYQYYFALWQAQQKNEYKKAEDYVPVVKEIVIPIPERNIRKRKLFSFLDKEEE